MLALVVLVMYAVKASVVPLIAAFSTFAGLKVCTSPVCSTSYPGRSGAAAASVNMVLRDELRDELVFARPAVLLLLDAAGEPVGDVLWTLGADVFDDQPGDVAWMESRVNLRDTAAGGIPEQRDVFQPELIDQALEVP